MLYRVFQENKAHQIFRKNKHFLCPDTHTRFEIFPFALLLAICEVREYWVDKIYFTQISLKIKRPPF